MINKQINRIILLIVFFFSLETNSWSQQGYVVFGQFGDKTCSGTGICQIRNTPFSTQTDHGVTQSTFVFFNSQMLPDNTHCSVTMSINMSELNIGPIGQPLQHQPGQFVNFNSGNYTFSNSMPIPTSIIGGAVFQAHPNANVTIPANIAVAVPPFPPQAAQVQNPFFIPINLNNLLITDNLKTEKHSKHPKPSKQIPKQ